MCMNCINSLQKGAQTEYENCKWHVKRALNEYKMKRNAFIHARNIEYYNMNE